GQQVVAVPNRGADPLGVASGGDDAVSGREGGLRDVDAHAPSGAGDKPNLLLGHPGAHPCLSVWETHRSVAQLRRSCAVWIGRSRTGPQNSAGSALGNRVSKSSTATHVGVTRIRAIG